MTQSESYCIHYRQNPPGFIYLFVVVVGFGQGRCEHILILGGTCPPVDMAITASPSINSYISGAIPCLACVSVHLLKWFEGFIFVSETYRVIFTGPHPDCEKSFAVV